MNNVTPMDSNNGAAKPEEHDPILKAETPVGGLVKIDEDSHAGIAAAQAKLAELEAAAGAIGRLHGRIQEEIRIMVNGAAQAAGINTEDKARRWNYVGDVGAFVRLQ